VRLRDLLSSACQTTPDKPQGQPNRYLGALSIELDNGSAQLRAEPYMTVIGSSAVAIRIWSELHHE
jgi:hypothetical protein